MTMKGFNKYLMNFYITFLAIYLTYIITSRECNNWFHYLKHCLKTDNNFYIAYVAIIIFLLIHLFFLVYIYLLLDKSKVNWLNSLIILIPPIIHAFFTMWILPSEISPYSDLPYVLKNIYIGGGILILLIPVFSVFKKIEKKFLKS